MRAQAWAGVLGLLLGVAGAACSLAESGFIECLRDSDCGPSAVCTRQYCVPLRPGCTRVEGSADAGDRIPLGAVVGAQPDGSVDALTTVRLQSMALAVSEANRAGGLDQRPFALFSCAAPEGDVAVRDAACWLVRNLEVPAILVVGSDRTRVVASNDDCSDAGTFVMSPSATNAGLTQVHERTHNLWRVAPPDSEQAKVLRSLILDADAGTRHAVGIFFEETDYGIGLKTLVSSELEGKATYRLYSYVPSSFTESQAKTLIARSIDGGATDTSLFIGFPTALGLLTKAALAWPELSPASGHLWLLADAAKDPSIGAGPGAPILQGALGTAPAQNKGTIFANFQASFKGRYGVDPASYSFTAHSYDATWLTMGAAAWASRDNGAITGPRMAGAIAQIISGPATPLLPANWLKLVQYLKAGGTCDVAGSSGPLDFDVDAGAPSSDYEIWTLGSTGLSTKEYRTPH